MSITTRRAAVLSFLALPLAFSTAASAGIPPLPNFSVNLDIEAAVRSTNPALPAYYAAFFRPNVTGFTDPSHPGNYVSVQSNTPNFFGDNNTSSSSGFSTIGELINAMNDTKDWTLSITDGATSNAYIYSFSVDAGFLAPDYLRPIQFVGLTNGADVGAAPVFGWTQDATDVPDAQYRTASALMYNDANTAIYSSPAITPADTSWAPDEAVDPGLYTLIVRQTNNKMNPNVITASMGTATGGNGGFITDFYTTVTATSEAVAFRLNVPAPASGGALFALAAFATRRRR